MADESLLFTDIGRQVQEIYTLPDRSSAYADLLHLLRRSADNSAAMEPLAISAPALLRLLLVDIHQNEEEIAAQALRCLGFMLYHPCLVTVISGDIAHSALESLIELILITPMKAICNLAVWCISVQQLDPSLLDSCLEKLTGAVVYALDNPFGSLSTTFEAVQALTKLSTCFSVKMRDMSHIWAPPVYRKLISNDKRERDVVERCLLKTKSIIFPSPPLLSKQIKFDLEQELLRAMMEMAQDHASMVLTIRAWGWYISLIGSEALNDRHLVNKMLKIPELGFGNPDPQVHVASLVAWRSFVDVLISPQIILHVKNTICHLLQQTETTQSFTSLLTHDDQIKTLVRRLKVLMVPLQGIISTEHHISVHLSFLHTWLFLLHKLDVVVNHPSVITTTFWPILEVIFSRAPDEKNLFLWSSCLDLLREFVLTKVQARGIVLTGRKHSPVAIKTSTRTGCPGSNKNHLKDYSINWLPWDINHLSLLLDMIAAIVCPERNRPLSSEFRSQAINAALDIFRLVLKGFQIEVERLHISPDMVQSYANIIFKFAKDVYESVEINSSDDHNNGLQRLHLKFIEALQEELDPSIMFSSAISNWFGSKNMNDFP